MIKIGHRGASPEPENTLASFERAIRLGADMIELDVQLSKDGRLVVIHDDTLERTTNGRGRVDEKTLAELKQLDAGHGERIPLLVEVLDQVGGTGVDMNIELKSAHTAQPTADLMRHYFSMEKRTWWPERFFVSSFDHRELARFCAEDTRVRIGVLFRKRYFALSPGRIVTGIPFRLMRTPRRLQACSLNLPFEYITQELVHKAQRNGFSVFAWTVNEPEDIARMRSFGVDGIFSDYPERLQPQATP